MPVKSTTKESGFTLVEMLIVLFIFSAVTSVVLISLQSLHSQKQTQSFLEQLQKDLYFSQEYALSHEKEVNLTFQPEKHHYVITAGPVVLFNRSYDKGITIISNFGNKVQFNPNGNIARFGTLRVQARLGAYKVVFHIGKGRFYVKKL